MWRAVTYADEVPRAGFSWWGAWGPAHLGSLSGRLYCKSLKIKNARLVSKKYEGFGGRPPVGWRPGTRAPAPPLKSGPRSASS